MREAVEETLVPKQNSSCHLPYKLKLSVQTQHTHFEVQNACTEQAKLQTSVTSNTHATLTTNSPSTSHVCYLPISTLAYQPSIGLIVRMLRYDSKQVVCLVLFNSTPATMVSYSAFSLSKNSIRDWM